MSYAKLSQDSPPDSGLSKCVNVKAQLFSINTPRSQKVGFLALRTPRSSLLRTPQSLRGSVTPKMKLDITPKSERKGSIRSPFSLSSPFRLIQRLTPRRNSWGACTPECCRDLEWSPHIDYRTPRSRKIWEFNSPLQGTPAKRVFSWSWEGEFTCENWMVDDFYDEAFEGGILKKEDFFPLTDLNSRVTHMLHVKDYDSLPSTL